MTGSEAGMATGFLIVDLPLCFLLQNCQNFLKPVAKPASLPVVVVDIYIYYLLF